jgi:hypothetical protein
MQFHSTAIIVAIGIALSTGCGDAAQPSGAKSGQDGANRGSNEAASAKKDDPSINEDAADDEDDEAQLFAVLDPKVRRATEIAESIERDPAASDQVLAQADLDREGLDALMYEIAINPELASQYRIARGLR